MASPATPSQISLRIMVNKQKNKVLFAEARKDFVDIVLSFLTMPLGTITRLVNKDTNSKGVTFGCLTSLYQSVHNLDPKYFNTQFCKQMLLQPRNPMEAHCRNLRLKIDDTQPTKYFVCEDYRCYQNDYYINVSTFMNQLCKCGRIMNKEIGCDASISVEEGYVHEGATFIIFDDLSVKTWDQCSSKVLHRILQIEDDAPQELTVNLSKNEVVDLLKFSLLSNSPLTELFLLKKQYIHLENTKPESLSLIKKETAEDDTNKVEVKVKVKVTQIKSKSKILFAQVEEDFIDVLLSFLTLPLGAVERVLHGDSNLRCIDNLFNSVVELNAKYFKSEKLKDMILNPGVAPNFKVNNQILPIDEVKHSRRLCHTKKYEKDQTKTLIDLTAQAISCKTYDAGAKCWLYKSSSPVMFLDPKAPLTKGETNKGNGYAKRVSMFMVTDELIVKPYSFISAVSILNNSKVEDHDLEETVISIGVKEVTSILKASITSSTALTDGLGPFIKCIKQEKAI